MSRQCNRKSCGGEPFTGVANSFVEWYFILCRMRLQAFDEKCHCASDLVILVVTNTNYSRVVDTVVAILIGDIWHSLWSYKIPTVAVKPITVTTVLDFLVICAPVLQLSWQPNFSRFGYREVVKVSRNAVPVPAAPNPKLRFTKHQVRVSSRYVRVSSR